MALGKEPKTGHEGHGGRRKKDGAVLFVFHGFVVKSASAILVVTAAGFRSSRALWRTKYILELEPTSTLSLEAGIGRPGGRVATKSSKSRCVPYVAAAGLALGLWAWAMVRLIGGGREDDVAPAFEALRIEVNLADEATLQTLPGIGGTYARRIVAERKAHGPFRKGEDLLRVRGVTLELINIIEPYIEFSIVDELDRPATQDEGKARP